MVMKSCKEIVKIKIATKSIKDDVELVQAIDASKDLGCDITVVQETHRNGSEILDFGDGWKFLHSCLREEHAIGIGIIISSESIINSVDYAMEGQIVNVLLTLNGIKISLIPVYYRRDCSPESSKSLFFSELRKTIANAKAKYPEYRTLVAGDFNELIDSDPGCLYRYNDDFDISCKGNVNYKKICALCEDFQLHVLNTMAQNEDINRFTWMHPGGYFRRIDYFLADYCFTRCTLDCLAPESITEDHEGGDVLLVLEVKCKTLTNIIEQLLTDIDDEIAPEMIEEPSEENPDQAPKLQCTNITESKRPPPWSDDKYQHLLHTMRTCRDVNERKNLKKRMKKERVRLKSAYYKQKAASINHADEMRNIQEEFRRVKDFKMTKKFKMPEEKNSNSCRMEEPEEKVSCHCPTPEEIRKQLCEEASERPPELSNPENFPYLKPIMINCIDDTPPTENEINAAIKAIVNDKCREADSNFNVRMEYINSVPFLQLIISLMRAIWSVIMYPACWLHSRICCILKNSGSYNAVKNYQGLSMSAALNKILTSVILGRIRNIYESNIMECQFGFRKNRSTTDAIFTVRKVIEYTDGLFIACFVDLGSAYNDINCESLFDVLEIRTGSKLIGQLIREMYCNTSAAMHSAKETIRTFVGCTQAESPCLFKIYLDFVLRICQHEVVQKYPNTGLKYHFNYPPECSSNMSSDVSQAKEIFTLRLLAYADDIMILCRDISEMEGIMKIYYRVFKRFGLTIEINKTKTMVFNAPEEKALEASLISIEDIPVENVQKFRFLGYVISNIDHGDYMEQQITSACQKWSELENVLTDREIQLSIRIHLLEAFVRSRLLYSAQAWRLSAADMRKVEHIWTHLLRRMIKGGFKRQNTSSSVSEAKEDWPYIYSNNDISKMTNSQPLSIFCELQYLKYIGHAIRQHDAFYPKIMLFAKPEKKHASDEWTYLEKCTGVDKYSLRKIMMDKRRFSKWLYER